MKITKTKKKYDKQQGIHKPRIMTPQQQDYKFRKESFEEYFFPSKDNTDFALWKATNRFNHPRQQIPITKKRKLYIGKNKSRKSIETVIF